jgi:hypothetical protein
LVEQLAQRGAGRIRLALELRPGAVGRVRDQIAQPRLAHLLLSAAQLRDSLVERFGLVGQRFEAGVQPLVEQRIEDHGAL